MKKLFPAFARILLITWIAAGPALAENSGVAAALGLEHTSVGAAVESGSERAWDQAAQDNDPTVRRMNDERSLFLRNAPQPAKPEAVQPQRDRQATQLEQLRNQVEKERDLALQQLEFRRNVEDAMRQILSFSTTVRPAVRSDTGRNEGQRTREAAPERLLASVEAAPLSARDRLLVSAMRKSGPFDSLEIPRELQEEAVRVQRRVEIDRRVVVPSRFEPTAEDDDGKPVRVVSEGGLPQSTVVNMRRNSRKAKANSRVGSSPRVRGDY